jgi:hypothetical protein
MEEVNIKINESQSMGFFSRLQQNNSIQEDPKDNQITSKEPPKNQAITSKGPPKNQPITSTGPPKNQTVIEPVIERLIEPVIEPVIERLIEPVIEPVIECLIEPVIEPVIECLIEPVIERVIEPVIEPVIEHVTEPVVASETSVEFVNRLNSTVRNIGHNKLQVKIEELENTIEKYKKTEGEQEMKLNLFKKTISTLQGQLQEKSVHITRLETTHIDPQYEKQIIDLNEKLVHWGNENKNLLGEFNTLRLDNDLLKTSLGDSKKETHVAVQQNTETKQRHYILESNHQKQAIQLQANNDNISKLQNKVNFEENIRRNLENELESMKVEMSRYRTDIKNITILKDNEIERLKNDLVKLNKIEQVNQVNEANQVNQVKNDTFSFIQGNILPRRNAAGQRLPANGISRRQMPSKR